MWGANVEAKNCMYPGYACRNDFDDAFKSYQRQYPKLTDAQLLEGMYRQCMGERERWRQELIRLRGPRYEGCRIRNFVADTETKKKAIEVLKDYGRNISTRVANGNGLILFGPKGTGKDHLAMALAQHAIMDDGIAVEWVNGMDLFGKFREAMDDDSKTSEKEIVNHYVECQLLYISDPVPPAGNLTEFQTAVLFRILDARYNRMRPTWVTVNVTSAAELDSRIGSQNGDRLRDGALAVFCNWQSYRKAIQ